jgi:hypothetical protein
VTRTASQLRSNSKLGSMIRFYPGHYSIIPRPAYSPLAGLGNHASSNSAGALAQSVEHRTFNPLVDGSIPSRPTINPDKTAR